MTFAIASPLTRIAALFSVAVASISSVSQSAAQPTVDERATELVQQLGQFRASLPATGRGDGRPDPIEERRSRIYDELRALGEALEPAIVRGLADPNVQVRRNVALFLGAAAGPWNDWNSTKPRLDIRPYLAALTAALSDGDSRVRGLTAHAVGIIGPDALPAVPALLVLLARPNEGNRGSACLTLAAIGPRARAALPALRKALSDSSPVVRRVAAHAISRIEERR